MKSEQVVIARRIGGDKKTLPWVGLSDAIHTELEAIQSIMFAKAHSDLKTHTVKVNDWEGFMHALDGKNIALVPWCGEEKCEEGIKGRSGAWADQKEEERAKAAPAPAAAAATRGAGGPEEEDTGPTGLTGSAKSLCIPFDQPPLPAGTRCVGCAAAAKTWCLFGRSY